MERVVVTGLGVASPLGCTATAFWDGLIAGRPGVTALADEQYAHLRTRIGGKLDGYNERDYFDPKEARRMSRASQMALVAAEQAINQAALLDGSVAREDVAVIIGSSIGGFTATDSYFKSYYQSGLAHPLIIPIAMNPGPSSNVSIRYGFQGPLMNVDAACASAAHAIGYCYYLIRSGQVQAAITGGSDSPFAPGIVAAWCALRALSERNDDPATACRPFSADRDGLVLGEGAGVLVLEAESAALRRGSRILAEVKGYAATGDSYHLTQPSPQGPARAMRRALDDAGLGLDQIDWINAHGTGTNWNDRTETAAIKAVFGDCALHIPVVAHKAAIGHAIGASAALQAVSCIQSLDSAMVPPTINYTTPDPACDLDYVIEGARQRVVRNVMSNSFAFGGSNAVLIFGRYEPRDG